MRISDWSSDVCSSDLDCLKINGSTAGRIRALSWPHSSMWRPTACASIEPSSELGTQPRPLKPRLRKSLTIFRSEEHTSELQSLMRLSYAVFCLKKNNNHYTQHHTITYLTEQTK